MSRVKFDLGVDVCREAYYVTCFLLSVSVICYKMGLIEFKVGWLGYQLAMVLTSQLEVVYICIL